MFTAPQLKRQLDELRTTPDTLLENASPEGYRDWSAERKNIAVQQLVLLRLGFDPGRIDGFVGPQTTFAYELSRTKDPDSLQRSKIRISERSLLPGRSTVHGRNRLPARWTSSSVKKALIRGRSSCRFLCGSPGRRTNQ